MKTQNKYIVQLRTDPAFDVIDTSTGQVVSVWDDVEAAAIDANMRLVMDLRDLRRIARKEPVKGRDYDELELWTIDQRNAQS